MYLNILWTLITGKAKAAIERIGSSGQMYYVVRRNLESDYERPELVVKAQLKTIHAYHLIKPHDSLEIVKYSQIVCGCANVPSRYRNENYIASDYVMNNTVRKSPHELKNNQIRT